MKRLCALATAAAVILVALPAYAHQDSRADDFCFAVLGFEGDGGPVFVIADEEELEETGALVGPPPELVPLGFVAGPGSDGTFEYRGTIAAAREALDEAGFEECEQPIG